MTTFALARERSTLHTAAGIVGFAVALAAASQVAVPLPGTPVPITLTPLVVVLAGLWLGPLAGATSMVLFLMAGAVGLPVFAPMGLPGLARLVGPTGGYLLAYPAAAFVAGWLGLRASGLTTRSLAAFAGMFVIYLGGVGQIAVLTGSLSQAMVLGALPFIALDAVKAIVAAAIAPRRSPPAA